MDKKIASLEMAKENLQTQLNRLFYDAKCVSTEISKIDDEIAKLKGNKIIPQQKLSGKKPDGKN
jgi:chaperonin cofactor prefoldin